MGSPDGRSQETAQGRFQGEHDRKRVKHDDRAGEGEAHFLELLFAPFSHLAASAASLSASADAAFFAAASALRAWPAAFLLLPPSAPPFFAMAIAVFVLCVVG